MPELTKEAIKSITIDSRMLDKFGLKNLHRARDLAIYKAPLLIIHKSPPVDKGRIRIVTSSEDIVYSETFYGYSAAGYENANILIKYLALIIGSKFSLWYLLMTSGEFGYEREVVEKILIQKIPVIPLDNLTTKSKKKINRLFDLLTIENTEKNWLEVDIWVAELFGLNTRDLQVINDTLLYSLPFSENKKLALAEPDDSLVSAFCEELSAELLPWMKRFKTKIHVFAMNNISTSSPWIIIGIQTSDTDKESGHRGAILRAANEIGTTEVFLPNESGKGLLVARLKQGRYWSQSQARLLARRIIWEHLETVFEQSEAA